MQRNCALSATASASHAAGTAAAAPGADVRYLAACISYGMGDYVNAECSIKAALNLLPDDEEILALYAEILWVQGKHDEARTMLERGLTVSRHHYQLLVLSGKMRIPEQPAQLQNNRANGAETETTA